MLLLRILIAETLVLFGSVIVGVTFRSEKAQSAANMVYGLAYFTILFTIAFGIAWAPS